MSVAYSKPCKEAIVAKLKGTKGNVGDEVGGEAGLGQITECLTGHFKNSEFILSLMIRQTIFSKYGHSFTHPTCCPAIRPVPGKGLNWFDSVSFPSWKPVAM